MPVASKQWFRFLVLGVVLSVSFAFSTLEAGFAATAVGDLAPLIISFLLVLVCWRSSRSAFASLRTFWILNTAAFVFLFLSHSYWFYYEVLRRKLAPSPIFPDGCYFLMPALMLAAFALRPHSASAASDLRFRRLDLAFLLSWWLCFFLYLVVPWLTVADDFASYNRANYFLELAQQLAVVLSLIFLRNRTSGAWRRFYSHVGLAYLVYSLANFLQGLAIAANKYYAGGIFDLPVALGALWVLYAFATAGDLRPVSDSSTEESDRQGLWAARLGVLAMISLPLLAIYGFLEGTASPAIIAYRLRLILGSMLFLGSLGFLRLYFLDRELNRLLNLTESSYDSLREAQERLAHSQKLAALGRLASGAAHEINNPLTAIYGYSDLLCDSPSLSSGEQALVAKIRKQVQIAQVAVSSMRHPENEPTLEHGQTPVPGTRSY
jgi:signal transduction histidine kinase